ncbi:Uncharacterised protein [Sphingobacterium daejeonense]|nr:Uncharacterised protein [Sphingobacterium daejeonense]
MKITSNTNAVGVACLLTPEGCNYYRKDYTAPHNPARGATIIEKIRPLSYYSGRWGHLPRRENPRGVSL